MYGNCDPATGRVTDNEGKPLLRYTILPQFPGCPETEAARVKQENVDRRINNRLYFNGYTYLGYQQPILEAVNPKYKDETSGKPNLANFLKDNAAETDPQKLAEKFRTLDIYSSIMDGKNYGQFNRLKNHKTRHYRVLHGPEERFCTPICSSFQYGWWLRDKDELTKDAWYGPRQRFPSVMGETTRFVHEMVKHDHNFILF